MRSRLPALLIQRCLDISSRVSREQAPLTLTISRHHKFPYMPNQLRPPLVRELKTALPNLRISTCPMRPRPGASRIAAGHGVTRIGRRIGIVDMDVSSKSWVDDIVIEEDTPGNNLPVGYLGTFRGSRHFIPEYPGMLPCSHNTKHLLLCGHWVSSSEPCGSNCKKQNHAEKPFNCPTCQEIVREVLTGSILSAVESIRLRKLEEKGNSIVYVSCCVEQVVRAAPQIKTGITEAVAGLLLENYGRKCEQGDNRVDCERHARAN